jgi:hypothetical protein
MTPPRRSAPVGRTSRTARMLPTRMRGAAGAHVVDRAGPIGGQPAGPPAKNDEGMPETPVAVTLPDAHDDTGTMDWNEEWDDSGKPKKTPEDSDDTGRITTIQNEDGKPSLEPDLDDSTKMTKSVGPTLDPDQIAPVTLAAPVPLPTSPDDKAQGSGIAAVIGDDVPLELGRTARGIRRALRGREIRTAIKPLGEPAPIPLQGQDSDNASLGGMYDDFPLEVGATKPDTQRLDNPPSPADVPEDMRYDPEGEGTPGIMPPVAAPSPSEESDDDPRENA